MLGRSTTMQLHWLPSQAGGWMGEGRRRRLQPERQSWLAGWLAAQDARCADPWWGHKSAAASCKLALCTW